MLPYIEKSLQSTDREKLINSCQDLIQKFKKCHFHSSLHLAKVLELWLLESFWFEFLREFYTFYEKRNCYLEYYLVEN